MDRDGNLYISEFLNHTVRKVSAATGSIATVAGTGKAGFNGEGGAARDAQLNLPDGIALDAQGNLYIADRGNHRVRKVNAGDGRISTVAGTGKPEFSGDGGPASAAGLNLPLDVQVDGAGNIYISDGYNFRVRKISAADGVIRTIAGKGEYGLDGDGGPAINAQFSVVLSMALDRAGNLYLTDLGRMRRVDAATGVITLIAGGGSSFSIPDGLDILAPYLPTAGIALDRAGSVFVSVYAFGRVLKIVPSLPGDVMPPVVRITSPSAGASYVAGNNPFEIKGEVSDNNAVVRMDWYNDRGNVDEAYRLSPRDKWTIPGRASFCGSPPAAGRLTNRWRTSTRRKTASFRSRSPSTSKPIKSS